MLFATLRPTNPSTFLVTEEFACAQGADACRGMHTETLFNSWETKPQNKQIWRRHSYKVEIIALAEPHETITIKSFSCPLKIGNMLSLLIVSSLRRNMLKCADSPNSIWFIFSPHGYPVYTNIKHEMQLVGTGLSTLPSNDCVCMCAFSLLGFRFILIVSF